MRYERNRKGEKPSEYTQCDKAFTCYSHHRSHEKIHSTEKSYYVIEFDEAFAVVFEYIKGHILEKNPTHVINVVKPFHRTVIFKYIKGHILEKNLINVINVIKLLQVMVSFIDIKENILERNPLNVINVIKLS
ncbi:hypothetical protein U0070_022281 [Myodes glareolus]|uniref:C2H2-type domain-containing protein n=1 Tax=Myodes glareolus TaxID=447135 RepID=A0AAW0GY75_MYOGA